MAGALAAVAISWTGSVLAADDAAKERREAVGATKAEAQGKARSAEETMKGEAERTRGDVNAPDARTERTRESARAGEQPQHPLFEGKNNFDLKGKVSEVSASSITIERSELPAAKLHVSGNTKVEVDGKKASVNELKQGQDVKASFNLQGDKVEAVEIKADKLEKGDRKEMSEQRRETQKEMGERARDAQQKNQQQRR
jgi:hypothetical protein